MMSGENARDEILPREREMEWLDACPEPLRTYSIIGVDLGLRLREFLNLAKRRCIFERDPRYPEGCVQVLSSKAIGPIETCLSRRGCVRY